ncbi:hypothetical protein NDU88_005234 [Pleurodeles waltl]|uniref:Uncharacterized protein n=1 Tax=Pleurodeles waltl TaxID=8319 RepID=A0AAV7WAV4_PLEWA|nr:hypothetical protein NDU88_005234 [Pleurodeles waltl]
MGEGRHPMGMCGGKDTDARRGTQNPTATHPLLWTEAVDCWESHGRENDSTGEESEAINGEVGNMSWDDDGHGKHDPEHIASTLPHNRETCNPPITGSTSTESQRKRSHRGSGTAELQEPGPPLCVRLRRGLAGSAIGSSRDPRSLTPREDPKRLQHTGEHPSGVEGGGGPRWRGSGRAYEHAGCWDAGPGSRLTA